MGQNNAIRRVMDLGCGKGETLDYFREKHPPFEWIGLDIVRSPEIESRVKTEGTFHLFDGVNIPLNDDYFDLIYCNQILEHVRYPADLLKEVNRVLKPDGFFTGSVSQLEQYHASSLWNYTPLGFNALIEEAGMRLVEVRPSIDALTLIIRRGFRGARFFSLWWKTESPLNLVISLLEKILRKPPAWINVRKLLFCGQFYFLVRKMDAASPPNK